MAFRQHLFNVGAVLVGKGLGDLLKDKVRYQIGPVVVDGRLVVGAVSILAGEYIPQVKMNQTLKAALDIIGALNLGEWLYDTIMGMVARPAPAPTAPVQAQAGLPVMVVPAGQVEVVGRII